MLLKRHFLPAQQTLQVKATGVTFITVYSLVGRWRWNLYVVLTQVLNVSWPVFLSPSKFLKTKFSDKTTYITWHPKKNLFFIVWGKIKVLQPFPFFVLEHLSSTLFPDISFSRSNWNIFYSSLYVIIIAQISSE